MRNSDVSDPIQHEFELVRDFMPILTTSKFDEDPIKNERAGLETPFTHYKYMTPFIHYKYMGHLKTLKGT